MTTPPSALLAIIFSAISLSVQAQSSPLFERLAKGSPWELSNPHANYKVYFRLNSDGVLQRRVQQEWHDVKDAMPEKVSWQSRDGHTMSVWLGVNGQVEISHSSPRHPSTFRSTK